MQHLNAGNVHRRKQKSFEQARISTYHFYMRHIRAAINCLDPALERDRQSTRSSPEKLPEKLTLISRHFR